MDIFNVEPVHAFLLRGQSISSVRPEHKSKRLPQSSLAAVEANTVEDMATFNARFFRSRKLLLFIASRILEGSDAADEALQNCWVTASRNPPKFEYEGAFRSWLLRVLIDEALAVLGERNWTVYVVE